MDQTTLGRLFMSLNVVGALLNGSDDAKETINELEDYLKKKKEEMEKQ